MSNIDKIRIAPHGLDLAPFDFWLFLKIKKNLRERVFSSNDDITNTVNIELEKLKKADFEKCFAMWLYKLQTCIDINHDNVDYFYVDDIEMFKIVKVLYVSM